MFIALVFVIRTTGFDYKASYGILQSITLFLGLTGFAYVTPYLNIKTDISYGVYIYHMTVMNALIALGYMHNQWLLLPVTIATCVLAWISTKTVGEWSKQRKQKSIVS